MAHNPLQQANHFPGDAIPYIPPQHHHHAPQNARDLPDVENAQFEAHWEDVHQQWDVAGPGRPQDPHHANVDHYVMADYHHRMPDDPADPYIFPNVEPAQGVQARGQADALGNQNHAHFDFGPWHVAALAGAAQGAIPHNFVHWVPTPVQQREDNLRRLVSRYLYHPGSQVNMVWMEPGATGRFNVVVILDASDVL